MFRGLSRALQSTARSAVGRGAPSTPASTSGSTYAPTGMGGSAPSSMRGRPFKKGGSASSRADGCAVRGKTKGRIV